MKGSATDKLTPAEMIDLFWRLRKRDFNLGVGDLLAALPLADGEWPPGRDKWSDLKMLWVDAGSASERVEREISFDTVLREIEADTVARMGDAEKGKESPDPATSSFEPEKSSAKQERPAHLPAGTTAEAGLLALPTSVPRLPVRRGGRVAVPGPLGRLSMAYAWHTLRQLRPEGPRTELDLEATIDRVAVERHYTGPVYKRRLCHRARLLLLIDRRGSMGPFHHLTSDLVETASEARAFDRLDVRYFHNLFTDYIYRDPLLNRWQAVDDLLGGIDARTMILIVSDAGAARGHFNPDRIIATIKLIVHLRKFGRETVWLNPMPSNRWEETSAEAISYAIPMFPLDRHGIFRAFHHLRNG